MEQFITDTLQPILTAIITTIVPLLLALACRWISKKTGIAISDASQQKLEDIATKAVLTVEEKATASLKQSGEKWPAYLKHKEAFDRIMTLAPALSHEQAEMLVYWAVAKIPGLGATGILGGNNGTVDIQPAVADPAPAG